MKHLPTANEHDDGQPSLTGSTVASGKYAIVSIGVLAVALVGFAVWFHYQQQRAPLDFWGADAAQLIVHAPEAEAWLLAETQPGNKNDTFEADGRSWQVVERRGVSRAAGYSHLRHSLINDRSFDWSAAGPATPIEWRYALLFRGADQGENGETRHQAIVLVSPNCNRVLPAGDTRSAAVPALSEALRQFLADQLPADSGETRERH